MSILDSEKTCFSLFVFFFFWPVFPLFLTRTPSNVPQTEGACWMVTPSTQAHGTSDSQGADAAMQHSNCLWRRISWDAEITFTFKKESSWNSINAEVLNTVTTIIAPTRATEGQRKADSGVRTPGHGVHMPLVRRTVNMQFKNPPLTASPPCPRRLIYLSGYIFPWLLM